MFEKFYQVVKTIPKGSVTTYKTVAVLSGYPNCARQVGYALHSNPDQASIPCHRVVFADGKVSSSFAFGGGEIQKAMLISEGVTFIGDKVDLEKHLYKG